MELSQFPKYKHERFMIRYLKVLEYARALSYDDTQYYERHHILPKCLGGTDDISNLILIPSRIHFIMHYLLWKAYRTRSMARAFTMMKVKIKSKDRYWKTNSKVYAKAKKEASGNLIPKDKRSETTKKTYQDNTSLRIQRSKVFSKNWEENYDTMKESSKKNFQKASQVKVKCLYCEYVGHPGHVASNHNEYCKNAPIEIRKVMTGTCIWCNFTGPLITVSSHHNDFCKQNPNRRIKKKTGPKPKPKI